MNPLRSTRRIPPHSHPLATLTIGLALVAPGSVAHAEPPGTKPGNIGEHGGTFYLKNYTLTEAWQAPPERPKSPISLPRAEAPTLTVSEQQVQAKALLDLAQALQEQKDPKAKEVLEQAAEAGSGYANYLLARHYLERGNSKSRDVEKGISFYKKSASMGFAGSCSDLGRIYLGKGGTLGLSSEEEAKIGTDAEKALFWIKKGADLENTSKTKNCPGTINDLRLQLARMYAAGVGTPKNATLALQAYEQAMWPQEEDHAILADVYSRVAKMEKDPEKAAELRAKAMEAAEKSGFDPTSVFADWEAAGTDTASPHPDKVIKNLRWAAELGHSGAQVAYAKILINGSKELVEQGLFTETTDASKLLEALKISRNSARAIELLEAAAAQETPEANFLLGEVYRTGSHTRSNRKKALSHYQQAADQGHAKAAYQAGRLLQAGVGEGENKDATARSLFEAAASQGEVDAEYQLALIYATGDGVAVDPSRAARHYLKAAASGHEGAQKLVVNAFIGRQAGGQEAASNSAIISSLRSSADDNAIFEYAQALAEQGDRVGQLALAECYKQGVGTMKDPAKSVELLRKVTGFEAQNSENQLEEERSTPPNASPRATKFDITVAGESVAVTRIGTGPIGVIFFGHTGVSQMNKYLLDNFKWLECLATKKCTFFLWNYPESAPFDQIKATLKAYMDAYNAARKAYRAAPAQSGWAGLVDDQVKEVRLAFPGIAADVVSQVKEESALNQYLIIGNSLGAGLVLWDYSQLVKDQSLSFLLISPTEAFMPEPSEIPQLERTTLLGAKGWKNNEMRTVRTDLWLSGAKAWDWAAANRDDELGDLITKSRAGESVERRQHQDGTSYTLSTPTDFEVGHKTIGAEINAELLDKLIRVQLGIAEKSILADPPQQR